MSNILSNAKNALIQTKQSFLNKKVGKWISAAMVSSFIACFACVTAFATDPEPSSSGGATITDMSSTIADCFGTLRTSLQSYISAVLPIAVGVLGTIFCVRFGINFFMSLTHREH